MSLCKPVKCAFCGKELVYDIVEDSYGFCDCTANLPEIALDEAVAMKDQFTESIEDVIDLYSDRGLDTAEMLRTLQSKVFDLEMNLRMPFIIELVKKALK